MIVIIVVVKPKRIILFTLCLVLLMQGIRLLNKSIQTGADAQEGVYVPIIMYHSILKNPSYNEKYIVSVNNLEEDLRFLKENGYGTVTVKNLTDYVYDGKPLCDKPVMLTFDDGFYNNMAYLLPLLEKYDSRAVISIVGEYTDSASENPDKNPAYAYLDWEDCRKMLQSGHIELQNHSYGFHNLKGERKGSKKISWETEEHYREMLKSDLGTMQDKMKAELGIVPEAYTYPFGMVSEASFDAVKELGFKASFSCSEGVSLITDDPECLYMLKRCIRTNDKGVEKILLSAAN